MMPPQNRSGTSTAKCQTAMPTMAQMRMLMPMPSPAYQRSNAAIPSASASRPAAGPSSGVTRAPVSKARSTMRSKRRRDRSLPCSGEPSRR
jgi:hypothetical protein